MEHDTLFPYQVFISYAKEDRKNADEFYDELVKHGIQAWVDYKQISPGENWALAINRAIKQCPYIIVLISKNSIVKRGYVQKEIREALDVADTIPDDEVYILPVRLEPCEVPERLKKWQWSDIYDPLEKQKLILFLKRKLGITNFPHLREQEKELKYLLSQELIVDSFLFKIFTNSENVLRSKGSSGTMYLSDGHIMDIRKRNTKFIKLFDEIFPSCQKLEDHIFKSVLPDSHQYKNQNNIINRISGPKMTLMKILYTIDGRKCGINRNYLSYINIKYPEGIIYMQSISKALAIEQDDHLCAVVMPKRVE